MKQIGKVLVFLLFSATTVVAQDNSNIVLYQYKNNKPITLKQNREITVICDMKSNGVDTIQKSYLGEVVGKDKNEIKLTILTEYTKVYSPQAKFTEYYKKYSYDTVISIKGADINHILSERNIQSVVEFASFVSLASLLVLAPLSGINIKNGSFNSAAYYSIAKPSAVAVIVTGIVYYNLGDRKFRFKQNL